MHSRKATAAAASPGSWLGPDHKWVHSLALAAILLIAFRMARPDRYLLHLPPDRVIPLGPCYSEWQDPRCLLAMPSLRPLPDLLNQNQHFNKGPKSSCAYESPHLFWGEFSLAHFSYQAWQWPPCLSEPHSSGALLKKIRFAVLTNLIFFHLSDLQLTGVILRAAKRIQINVYVKKLDDFV